MNGYKNVAFKSEWVDAERFYASAGAFGNVVGYTVDGLTIHTSGGERNATVILDVWRDDLPHYGPKDNAHCLTVVSFGGQKRQYPLSSSAEDILTFVEDRP